MFENTLSVARRWYTEQRGRTLGNTKAWEDLSRSEQIEILDQVESTLEKMEGAWSVTSTSSE